MPTEPKYLIALPEALKQLAAPDAPRFYTAAGIAQLLGLTRRQAGRLLGEMEDAKKESVGWIVPRVALAQHLAEVFREHGGDKHPVLRLIERLREPVDEVPPSEATPAISPVGSRYEVTPGEIRVRCRSMKEFSAVALQLVREARTDRRRQTEIERELRRR